MCIGGGGILWFGVKYFEMLTFCHRMISDPNQSPSDISSDVLLKIILSPVISVHSRLFSAMNCFVEKIRTSGLIHEYIFQDSIINI